MFQMLIIDDDKELCQLLEDYFRPEHIAFKELLFEFIPPKNCISLLP